MRNQKLQQKYIFCSANLKYPKKELTLKYAQVLTHLEPVPIQN